MPNGTMSICEKFPPLIRALLPVGVFCALLGTLLAAPAEGQSARPVAASVSPDMRAVSPRAVPEVARARSGPGPIPTARLPAAPDAADVLLSRTFSEPSANRASGPDLGSLRDFLPAALFRDVVELRDRAIRVRSRLFGRRGIVSFGGAGEDGDLGRVRVNLQYDPDPGIRVTLITR